MTRENPVFGDRHSKVRGAGILEASGYTDIFRKAYTFTRANEARASGF